MTKLHTYPYTDIQVSNQNKTLLTKPGPNVSIQHEASIPIQQVGITPSVSIYLSLSFFGNSLILIYKAC